MAAPFPITGEPRSPATTRRRTVLIAESQPLGGEALARALGKRPTLHVLLERPHSADDAVRVVAERRPDVVLLDFWLTALPGPEAITAMLAAYPDTKVLALSSWHSPAHIEAALNAGAVGFLPRSLTVGKVAEAIRRAHAGEVPVFGRELAALLRRIAARDQRVDDVTARFATLSRREHEVLALIAAGQPVDRIAQQLAISPATVRTHTTNLLAKTGARSQVLLVVWAHSLGILPQEG